MQFGSDDLAKYPFLQETGEFIRKSEISVTDLIDPVFKNVVSRAEERVLEAIKAGKVSDKTGTKEIEIMSFPVSLMLVRSTKLDHLMDRYALAEAIRAETLLNRERKDQIIQEIFTTILGISLEHSILPNSPGFKINVADYVKRAFTFHKSEWKLVNRMVYGGKVYVSQHDLIRLIREEIRDLILQRLKAANMPKLPPDLDMISKKLIQLAPPPRSAYSVINIGPENYPPCVREALRLLEKGENVPHYGRFLMSTYLLAVGKSVEDIMALFPKAPDFKASVTKYQVEHIAGLKGGRTRYTVPSCKTLQTHAFCFKDPIKCYEISSPLQYPSKKIASAERLPGNKHGVQKITKQKEDERSWKVRR